MNVLQLEEDNDDILLLSFINPYIVGWYKKSAIKP